VDPSGKRKILILGATGVVGRETLRRALTDPRIGQIIAPTRRVLESHAKLVNPVATDLDLLLPDAASWRVDAVICAMGTTIAKAGSKEAFRHIDYELPIAFGRLAHQQGAEAFVLVSSVGASTTIPLFYNRTKGEVERDIVAIGFRSLTILRPGPIGGDREEFRLAERVVLPLLKVLGPLLPRSFRINYATRIAEVLIEAAVTARPGQHMVTSRDLA
jgi:uncharacterized protein YbjT (DUF2867 family)